MIHVLHESALPLERDVVHSQGRPNSVYSALRHLPVLMLKGA